MIDRRTLLALPFAAALPCVLRAQAHEPPVVGFLGLASQAADQPAVAALKAGLTAIGHVDGRTIRLETRHADGHIDRLPALLKELEAQRVVVIVAAGRAIARALNRLTKIPIVAGRLPESDPELFASLARPGGNVTGFSNFAEQLYVKQVEILKEMLPGLAAVGIMHNVISPRDYGAEAEVAARAQGLRTIRLGLGPNARAEIGPLIRSLRPAGAGALIVVQDFSTITVGGEINRVALSERLPTVADQRDMAESGALLSYGADIDDLFRRAADYVDRTLKGAKPADLPIQLATKLQLFVNAKTAKALGLTIPPAILLRADEVIE